MQLTGPPKINDYVAPYCSSQTPLDAAWRSDDEIATWNKLRTGELKPASSTQALRGRFVLEWRGLTYEDAARILYEIRGGEVTLTPRTSVEGEGVSFDAGSGVQVALEEVALPCRVVGRYPTSTPLNAQVGDTKAATLRIELETKQTYSGVPGFGTPATFAYRVSASSGDEIEAQVVGPIRDQLISWTVTDVLSGSTIATIESKDFSYSDWLSDERTYRITAAFSQDTLGGLERIHSFAKGQDDWSTSDTDYDAIPDTCIISTLSDSDPRVTSMELVFDTSLGSTGDYEPVDGTVVGLPLAPDGTEYELEIEVTPEGRDPVYRRISGTVAETEVSGEGIGVSYEETTFNEGVSGEHRMKVAGAMPEMGFRDQHYEDIPNKLVAVVEWSNLTWDDTPDGYERTFHGCANLLTTGFDMSFDGTDWVPVAETEAEYVPAPIGGLEGTFRDCTRYGDPDRVGTDCDIGDWDVSNLNSINGVFDRCGNFNQNLDSWDTSGMTSITRMFVLGGNFNNGEPAGNTVLLDWDVSSCTDLQGNFVGCNSMNLDFSSWDVSNVTDMRRLFEDTTSFDNDSIVGWNTAALENANRMFAGSIFDQDIGDWNVASLVTAQSMFVEAPNFNQDLAGWSTAALKNVSGMFREASSYTNGGEPLDDTHPTESGWDMSVVTDADRMFRDCPYNNSLANWNTTSVQTTELMFSGSDCLFNQDISAWDVSSVTNMRGMFQGNVAFNQALGAWTVEAVAVFDSANPVTNVAQTFAGGANAWSAANVDATLDGWDTNATDIAADRVTFDAGLDGQIVTTMPDSKLEVYTALNDKQN